MWWQVCKFRLARRLLRTSCQVVHPPPLFPCSAVRGLLGNPHLQMAPYIHHLLPGWLPLWRVAVPAPANMLWGALQLLAFSYKACRRVAPCAAILTCLVARGVGTTATGWSIREEASFGCSSPLLHSWHEREQRVVIHQYVRPHLSRSTCRLQRCLALLHSDRRSTMTSWRQH